MTEWRKNEELKPGPIRHLELPPALVARIDLLRSTLDEVYPQSRAEWLEGFQRDTNPEWEIQWWEGLARCYVEYSGKRALNLEQRKKAFNVMFKLLFGSTVDDIMPELVGLPSTALDDISDILRRMGE